MRDFAILMPTFNKRHRYFPTVELILKDEFDIQEPFYIVTDAPIENSVSNVIVSDKRSWAEILLDGLLEVEAKVNPKYIFVLLEDLIPFSTVNRDKFFRDFSLIEQHGYKNLSFCTYSKSYPEMIRIEETHFYKIPDDYIYYSQLQPAFWELDYLKSILTGMISSGKTSAWDFEFVNLGHPHLISLYVWPNILGGFIEAGKVNVHALKIMDRSPNLRKLRKQLYRDLIKASPSFFFKRVGRKLKK